MNLEFIIKEKQDFKNNVLIAGFHGIGTTGFIAVKYIINQINAKKIGVILTESIPPFITTKDGKISMPFELFKKEEYVILIPQFQPYKHEQKIFAECLTNWTLESNFKKVILIGGLDARLKKDASDKIRSIMTSEYQKNYETISPILEEGLFVTGPIALLLTYFEVKDFPAIALLPYAESSRADPLAAAAAIEKINKITNLKINTNNLIQDAELIEKNLQELLNQTKEQTLEEKEQKTKKLYI